MNTETEFIEVVGNESLTQTPNIPHIIRDIDIYLGQTFDAMSVIDESYGKISSYFVKLSNQIIGETDFEQLSEREQKEALLYMGAAIAVQGACAVTKGIKETIALRKVQQIHRQVAEMRMESLSRMLERVRCCHDDAAMLLLRHNGHPFKSADVKKRFKSIADTLEVELCQYRDVRFRLDMLRWLKDEYEAWLDGELYSNTPMPTTGQATVAAIYLLAGNIHVAGMTSLMVVDAAAAVQPPISTTNLKEGLRGFSTQLAKRFDPSISMQGKDFFSAFDILAIVDRQMAAVLEYNYLDEDPLASAKSDDDDRIDSDKVTCTRLYADICRSVFKADLPYLKKALNKNPICIKSLDSLNAFYDMQQQESKGSMRVLINGLLIMAALIIPVWNQGWTWYWALALSALIFWLVCSWIISPMVRKISNKFETKFTMMTINYEYIIAKEAGLIEPKSKIKEMAEMRNHFWLGLILGGIIGMIGGPLGAVIGAVVGAIIGSSSSDDVDDHGMGWNDIKICSPVKQWFTTIIAISAVAIEIIGFMNNN